MAFLSDISVDWTVSPRVITVLSPTTSISIQDLYDTLRILEERQPSYPQIASAGGKENLGSGNFVGITLTLLNAVIQFEARGTPTVCDVSGGNLVATDSIGDPLYPIIYSNNVLPSFAQSSSPTISQAELDAQLPGAVADAVWDEALVDHVISGSTGEAQAATPPTVSTIADAVWDEPLADHSAAGSTGEAQAVTPPTTGDIADAVWDEPLADHGAAGSTGESQAVTPPTVGDIADAVWDEPLAGHTTAGTMGESQNSSATIASDILDELLAGHFTPDSVGEALTLIRGLVQQNYMVDSTVFNASGLMTSARFRLFSTGAEVGSATDEGSGEGELASFTVTAVGETSDPTQLRFYKVARD